MKDLLRIADLAELGVMSASLVHEIRHPLMAIKAYVQLADGQGRALSADELALVRAQVAHLEGLIELYSGVPSEGASRQVLDWREACAAAAAMLAHRARRRGVELRTEFPARPVWVVGNEIALRQVVANLVHNALDAVEGQPERRVELVLEAVGDRARLVVADTGVGVSEEVRSRLFEPFVTTKPPGQGTGLGLYVSRKRVEELGGTLAAHHLNGNGTRMEVTLPLHPEAVKVRA